MVSRLALSLHSLAARPRLGQLSMPPKKKARLTESIRTDLEAAFGSVSREHLVAPDHLPDDLVLRAYGLAGPRKGQKDGATFNRTCLPRWQPEASPQAGPATKSTTPASRATSTEVLILDTGSEHSADEEKPRPILKSAKGKGKGKGKAVVEAEKEKPCAPENCGNNPNCLNWLGQDKWENTSESRLYTSEKAVRRLIPGPEDFAEKALADFRKAAKLPADPSNDRDPDLPGGLVVCVYRSDDLSCGQPSLCGGLPTEPRRDVLRQLVLAGALELLGQRINELDAELCSRISQVWYRDVRFRRGVYSCLPASNGNVEVRSGTRSSPGQVLRLIARSLLHLPDVADVPAASPVRLLAKVATSGVRPGTAR